MKKYLPIFLALVVVAVLALVAVSKKANPSYPESQAKVTNANIGTFKKERSCVRTPSFLNQLKIPQPVMIDLSQKRYKGIAFLYGKNMQRVLHPKVWEQYEHFSTYALDKLGNIFLAPMPHISIHPTTFNLQKNIYKLDTKTGKISIYMHFEEIEPSANNPFGIFSIAYDCDDNTLWVSAIDQSDYQEQRGRIYHIDIESKKILEVIENVDALTLTLLKTNKSKYLLVGSARDNGLYAYDLNKALNSQKSIKIISLPNGNEHIRKIKIKASNEIELQSIPFTYTLIAQSGKEDRIYYQLLWDLSKKSWYLK